jgi:hypothetical protein
MKLHRVLTLLAVWGVTLSSGCAGLSGSPKGPGAPGAPPALKADVDPRQPPAPRLDPVVTPELSGAVYAINAGTLEGMGRNGVPLAVVNGLRKLDGKTYTNARDFLAAVKEAIGEKALAQHQEAILRNALVVTLADPLLGPRGQTSLDEAAARSQIRLLKPTSANSPPGGHPVARSGSAPPALPPAAGAGLNAAAARPVEPPGAPPETVAGAP